MDVSIVETKINDSNDLSTCKYVLQVRKGKKRSGKILFEQSGMRYGVLIAQALNWCRGNAANIQRWYYSDGKMLKSAFKVTNILCADIDTQSVINSIISGVQNKVIKSKYNN